MSEFGDFVDASLKRESSEYRAEEMRDRLGSDLVFYGASVGAVRGTIKDVGRRYPDLRHDDITALSSELWAPPVFERRLAAIVLLQTHVRLLTNFDLTRIEGFLRSARLRELAQSLAADVVRPLRANLVGVDRARADKTLARWSADGDPSLARAASLARDDHTVDGPRTL